MIGHMHNNKLMQAQARGIILCVHALHCVHTYVYVEVAKSCFMTVCQVMFFGGTQA